MTKDSFKDKNLKDHHHHHYSKHSKHGKTKKQREKEESKGKSKEETKASPVPGTTSRLKVGVIFGIAISLISLMVGSIVVIKGVSLFGDRKQVRMNIDDKQRQLNDLREQNLEMQQKLSDVSVQLYEELNKQQQLLEEDYQMNKRLQLKPPDDLSRPSQTKEHRNAQLSSKTSCQGYLLETDRSGVYTVATGKMNIRVYCDMDTDFGGWMVFQRRFEGVIDFFQDFNTYEEGFGNLQKEHWMGLRHLNAITEGVPHELRVELEDWKGNVTFAKYRHFAVGNRQSNYKLSVRGYYGNAGDALSYHNNRPFSAKDRDNDAAPNKHCAKDYHGAWWFGACHTSNLNGEYLRRGQISEGGVIWWIWKKKWYSLKRTEMKIRPKQIRPAKT